MVSLAVSGAEGPPGRARSKVTRPRVVIATTRSASRVILSAVSTATTATGGSSDMLSVSSLRSWWRGPKPAMPRNMTLVATAELP